MYSAGLVVTAGSEFCTRPNRRASEVGIVRRSKPERHQVMIIDGSSTIRRSAEIFLVQAGCQVVLAEDGFDALRRSQITNQQSSLRHHDARLDGYQTCALIKKTNGSAAPR